jgi:hypothetical protein
VTRIDVTPQATVEEREAIRKALAAIGMIEPDAVEATEHPVEPSRP